MSWNYRLVNYGTHLALHEVYYGEDGSITGVTVHPRAVTGDTIQDIEEDLKLMLETLRRHPVLREDELPQ